jgi:pyrroloquinoline quinone biosynthesis protein B
MLHLKLLGSAAGGGIPQWNCSCSLCDLSRKYPTVLPPRLQLQAALSDDNERWVLLNASPDLRVQIEANPELQPSAASGKRNTPIEAIVLTSADLDQVLGVLLLREFQPLTIYATLLVRKTLEANSFFKMMHRVQNQLTWIEMTPGETFVLGNSGIACTPIPLPGGLPFYAKELDTGVEGDAAVGLLLESAGRRIAYTPAVPEITAKLKAIYEMCTVILVDGTFWSDAELTSTHAGTPMARAIGHVPLSGPEGTIELLADVKKPEKIFVHINNTNPMLDSRSAEHRAVIQAGWKIGYDGWQLNWQ